MADPQPPGAAPTGAGPRWPGPQPGGDGHRRSGVPGRLAALQQRSAAGAADRLRRAAVWMLVERTIATRRLAPVAGAIVVAVFCVTLAPQGLVALAPLLVGARAVARTDRRPPGRATGCWPRWLRLAAALSLFFVVVFRDQTLASVAESVRIKYVVGPTISWYQDFLRYYFLTVEEHVEGLPDPAFRRPGHAAVPVRHADDAATQRPGCQGWPADRCGGSSAAPRWACCC